MDDIGSLFPDTDPMLAGADSVGLLREVVSRLQQRDCRVVNVDAVVVCEEPRIGPHRGLMRAILADALGVDPVAVNVKGKTTEGMGFTGRGEGIAAQAVVLLEIETTVDG